MATDIMGVCARRIFIPSGIKPRLNKHYGSLNRNTGSLKPDKWLSGYWTGGSERSVQFQKKCPHAIKLQFSNTGKVTTSSLCYILSGDNIGLSYRNGTL
jgi:hypothetical protein